MLQYINSKGSQLVTEYSNIQLFQILFSLSKRRLSRSLSFSGKYFFFLQHPIFFFNNKSTKQIAMFSVSFIACIEYKYNVYIIVSMLNKNVEFYCTAYRMQAKWIVCRFELMFNKQNTCRHDFSFSLSYPLLTKKIQK